jgi:hypothetical protein
MTTTPTITYERIIRPAVRCSTPWCELPADHDVVSHEEPGDGSRMHSCTLATWRATEG